MNETEEGLNFVLCSRRDETQGRAPLAVMSTGADRLLRGGAAPVSARPRSSRMKRASEQRCSAAVQ